MIVRSFVEQILVGLRYAGLRKSNARKNRSQAQISVVSTEQLETRQLLTISFNFIYPGPITQGGLGFEDGTFGQERREALQNVADEFGAQFENTATIDITVSSTDDPNTNTLASAGSRASFNGNSPIFGGIQVVRNKILTGIDLNGANSDGIVDVNWANNFELSGDPADVGAGEFDFHTVISHELTHVIGLSSSVSQTGTSITGALPGVASIWYQFDQFLSDSTGTPVINAAGVLDQAAWTTLSVGGSSTTGDGLFFNGPAATAANNGQPVGLFTPTTYSPGSSVSHLDNTEPAFANFITLSAIQAGRATRGFSAIEEGLFIDLGYTLADDITVIQTNDSTTVSDFGNADVIDVSLGRQPLANVVLTLDVNDATEVSLGTTTLTFTPANWDVPQRVDVFGVADLIPDSDQISQLSISVVDAQSDITFGSVEDVVIPVTSVDDDGFLPELPVVVAPTGGAVSNSPTFEWVAGANNETFRLTVTDVATGTVTRQATGLTATSHVFPGTLPDGVYRINVEAFNLTGQGSGLSQPVLFAVGVPSLPIAPSLTSPTLGQVFPTSTPQFTWTPVPVAFGYELEVVAGGQTFFHSLDVTLATTGNLSHTFPDVFAEGAGTARVRALNALGQAGEWSAIVPFTIDAFAQPAAPTIITPTANVSPNAFPLFSWTRPAGAGTFELWVGRVPDADGTGTAGSVNNRVIRLTDHPSASYTHFSPLPNGSYVAWVRTFNSVGEASPWSRPAAFDIGVPVPDRPAIETFLENNGTNPTLGWVSTGEDFPVGTTFHLWVNNLSTGESRVVEEQQLTDTTFTFTDGLPQGKYGAWVRATSPLGDRSPWSVRFDFEVDIDAPGRPVLTGPTAAIGEVVVESEFPVFTWDAVEGAASYDLWVNSVSGQQSQIIRVRDIPGEATSYTHDEALPEGTYRAWLRAANTAGEVGEWSVPIDFALNVPGPAQPTITGPIPASGGAVETSTPTITWTSLGGAASYNLQFEVVSTGESLVNVTGLTEQQFSITETLPEQTYRVRVQGVNSVGEVGAWSAFHVFTVDVPNATTPVANLPQGTVTESQVTFQWQHTPSSIRYEILVRDLLRQESIVIQVETLELDQSGSVAVHTATLDDGTYRYWVRAFNTQGTASGWSNSLSFTVNTVASVTQEPESRLEIAMASLTSAEQSVVDDSEVREERSTVSQQADAPADVEAVMAEFADPANHGFSQEA